MALYIVGLGLNGEKDITVKGLEAVKKCELAYLENYTSKLNCGIADLEKFYNKKIRPANRNLVEADSNEILNDAKSKNVALLVIGDPMSATTHIDLCLRAKRAGIKCHVIHNASVITAVGITGLQLYKFGRTASIPLHNENVESPYDVLKGNLGLGLHTLFLLDLEPENSKYMTINDAIRYLLTVELRRNEKAFSEKTLCVGCARIGSESQAIKAGTAKELLKFDFGEPVYCLIVPGKLHFVEEEALQLYK
ncbi:diphthine synthase [Candidatus Woesearchaeota archaeon]|nr:diphthine synthase [Candidatus Woesearchaeota archaeon]